MTDSRPRLTLVRVKDDGGFNVDVPPDRGHVDFVDYLFRRYRQALQQYVHGLVRNRPLAEDIVQETYIRAMKAKDLEHRESKARSYLYTIATNLVRDQYRYDRSHGRDEEVSLDDVSLPGDEPHLEQLLEWRQGLQEVKHCLLGLSPRCRKVFILHTFEEVSLKDIAGMLGVSTKTVKRDLTLALERCQNRLKEYK